MRVKSYIMALAGLMTGACAMAKDIEVTQFSYAGPYILHTPVMIDSVDVNSKKYGAAAMLDTSLDLTAVESGTQIGTGYIPGCDTSKALHLLGFTISNTSYTTATVAVDGLKHYQVFVDGKQVNGGYATLEPSVHKVVIKYLSSPAKADSVSVSVDGDRLTVGTLDSSVRHPYNIYDAIKARTFTRVSVSPNGRYVIYGTSETQTGGTTQRATYLRDLQTGQVSEVRSAVYWMPRSSKYYYTRKNDGAGYTLISVDPQTKAETVLSRHLPKDAFSMSPTEDYIIYTVEKEGPKEKKDVFEVLEPEDRQPGWRKRTNLFRYDLKSGLVQQLTYGYHDVWLNDISSDGKHILITKSESRLEARPTTLYSLYRIGMDSHTVDTLISGDGFVNSCCFSPDGTQVIASGSPDALGGVGRNVAEGQTPSMYDYQLYLSPVLKEGENLTADRWTPLTRHFNPAVQRFIWSQHDGQVYFTAEDRDFQHLYRLNPKNGNITLMDCGEELVENFSVADAAGVIAYYGQGASNGDRLYTMSSKSQKRTFLLEADKEHNETFSLGKCEAWECLNAEGDTICCRYYLPSDFEPGRKYPMIVNYYGGCSPTSRNFQSRYPQHAYASLGYVVLVINPRGATGFGQKWSAAHVNTAGKGVAEDIICAVRKFCEQHDYVNDKKVGCIGASYGGFMTQYLQTVTDIFAAAVSHAGISDHTSYWGEGYWGYSYSEVSMANSYPWTRKDLYVDQSPLYNADKVHTPLLFVHGTGDTNVPVGESIQMYTALKLLGRPTAMVLVDGENHWITDYKKRLHWQNTIWAWFAKYLQDDDSWWESMYARKNL